MQSMGLRGFSTPKDVRAALALLAAELTLFLLAFAIEAGIWPLLALHLALVAAFARFAHPERRQDQSFFILFLLTTLTAGPVGTAATIAIVIALQMKKTNFVDLQKWYGQLSGTSEASAAARLHSRILDDRVYQPAQQAVVPFSQILRGPVAGQQSLLGLIGRDYHAEYRNLLQTALRSPEPSVRVQSAAVFVKLRGRIRNQLLTGMEASQKPEESSPLDTVKVLRHVANSGFLDEHDQISARERALFLCRQRSHTDDKEQQFLMGSLLADAGKWSELLCMVENNADTQPELFAAFHTQCLMHTGRIARLHDSLSALPERTDTIRNASLS